MGGAQPLAVTMNEGVAICVDCDESRIDRRIDHRYLDTKAGSIDEALALAIEARDARRPLSIGLVGNAADMFPELLERDTHRHRDRPDVGARSLVLSAERRALRGHEEDGRKRPGVLHRAGPRLDGQARQGDGRFMDKGAEVFDYGNSIRDEARKAGYDRAFDFPGFVPAYIRPQFEEDSVRSDGRRCRVIRRTSRRPTARSWSCS